MTALALVPFADASAATVAGWVHSADEAEMWCGRREHPISPWLVRRWQTDPDTRGRVLLAGAEPVGYGELWVDEAEDEVELARIIVAPAHRRHGVGQELVRLLVAEALAFRTSDVFLRVHPRNEPALRCYLRAGLVEVPADDAALWNAEQPVAYRWLTAGPVSAG